MKATRRWSKSKHRNYNVLICSENLKCSSQSKKLYISPPFDRAQKCRGILWLYLLCCVATLTCWRISLMRFFCCSSNIFFICSRCFSCISKRRCISVCWRKASVLMATSSSSLPTEMINDEWSNYDFDIKVNKRSQVFPNVNERTKKNLAAKTNSAGIRN